MRVCFDVHGASEDELLAETHKVLDRFSKGKRWSIDITAHAELVDQLDAVQSWRGEVEAYHEDPE
jgi:putative lipoic acid-binding regulatory protein